MCSVDLSLPGFVIRQRGLDRGLAPANEEVCRVPLYSDSPSTGSFAIRVLVAFTLSFFTQCWYFGIWILSFSFFLTSPPFLFRGARRHVVDRSAKGSWFSYILAFLKAYGFPWRKKDNISQLYWHTLDVTRHASQMLSKRHIFWCGRSTAQCHVFLGLEFPVHIELSSTCENYTENLFESWEPSNLFCPNGPKSST